MNKKIRVAALQFGAGNDVEANLVKCVEMIDKAAADKPDLMVLPEFCNHLSWYDDKDHCFQVSVPVGGEFLNTIFIPLPWMKPLCMCQYVLQKTRCLL